MKAPVLSLPFLLAQPDATLIALARAGHEPAFEALIRRYRRQLLGYCRRVGTANASTEDALQQALLQAWLALCGGLEVRDARAWLYRIAHNVAVSNARRREDVPMPMQGAVRARGTEEEAEQRMAARAALAGVAALPALQRAVLLGSALDGMTHAELARELGLSSGAVRGLIYRARLALRAAAAALMPSPVVHWAARHGAHAGSVAPHGAAFAGGTGSPGLGTLLLKGGAMAATAGALVSVAGMSHRGMRSSPPRGSTAAHGGHATRALAGPHERGGRRFAGGSEVSFATLTHGRGHAGTPGTIDHWLVAQRQSVAAVGSAGHYVISVGLRGPHPTARGERPSPIAGGSGTLGTGGGGSSSGGDRNANGVQTPMGATRSHYGGGDGSPEGADQSELGIKSRSEAATAAGHDGSDAASGKWAYGQGSGSDTASTASAGWNGPTLGTQTQTASATDAQRVLGAVTGVAKSLTGAATDAVSGTGQGGTDSHALGFASGEGR